jgi:NADH-quinone oxidoreductase subunit L
MGGLKKAMPITFITMLIASLAISGIFPLAGFWSKDEILMTAFHHNIALWVIGSIASIMTAFYMFRLMYLTFFKSFRGTEEQEHHLHESPSLITFPLVILAVLSFFGGLISLPGNSWLNDYLSPLFSKATSQEHSFGTTEYTLMAIATIGAIAGILYARLKYVKNSIIPSEDSEIKGLTKVLYNKYYVDQAYDAIFVKPVNFLSNFFRDTVETTLSAMVLGLGKATNELAFQGKKLQNGSVGFYLFAFVIGVCAILTYFYYQNNF